MSLTDRIKAGTWTADPGPASVAPGSVSSLAQFAARVDGGADVLETARNLLDQYQRLDPAPLDRFLSAEPPLVDEHFDALVAGLAEFLALGAGLPIPSWVDGAGRTLDRFWFVSEVEGLHAISIVEAPISLRRRGIMWPRRSLTRV